MTETSVITNQFRINILVHNLAARFFECRQFWIFTIPQATLTMIPSSLAFMAATDLIDENMKLILNTVVGSTSAFIVFLQVMSGICSYRTRGAMHKSHGNQFERPMG